jgi:hypothetical protein
MKLKYAQKVQKIDQKFIEEHPLNALLD